ncbi:MAG TPA: cyanophycinase [Longimicrobiales bacterium]
MNRQQRGLIATVVAAFALGAAQAAGQEGPQGSLLIVGGGAQPPELVQRFVDLAGGAGRARIAVIPLASGASKESGDEKVAQFVDEYGADAFNFMPLRAEAEAGIPRVLDGVTGVWFTGGDQERITDVLAGTRLLEQIRELYRRGAVIGGTSAGAAIMSDSMLTGNQFDADTVGYFGDEFPVIATRRMQIVPGLGFLSGAIVDQHFLARERHNRLLSVVLERPSLVGVGIDESTALEVRPDGSWKVLGLSQVIVYDARAANIVVTRGTQLGAAGIRVHLLPPGSVYDPATGAVTLASGSLGVSTTQENAQ